MKSLMRTFISATLATAMVLPGAFALAATDDTTELILSEIFSAQGVHEKSAINCAALPQGMHERYGEAYLRESLAEVPGGFETFSSRLSPEKRETVFREIGSQDLGCIAAPDALKNSFTDVAPVSLSTLKGEDARMPLRGGNMGFIATWTTIVWMFSALGFAVFMIWVTSSKFRFQFRKMAEGELDTNDRAMTILKERFARGEVTKEQFDKMRRDILN
jgi:uncharacterized membrane protein